MKENKSLPPRIPFRQKIALVLFGLFLFFVLLEVGLRISGAILLSLQDHRNELSLKHTGTYKILCLGESTTQGQYPPFLEEILNQRNIGIRFSVIDKGRAGTNTPVILSQVESYLDTYHPDMVVAMMGINDWGAHMSYERPSSSTALRFLRSFKIYKLSRLLWLHMATKAQEIKLLFLKQSGRSSSLKQASVEQTQETSLKEFLKLNPKNDQAYFRLGCVYRGRGQLPQAKECFEKGLELNPKNDQAYLWLGWFYHDQGQLSQAKECFKKAVELNPKSDQAYFGLGFVYYDQGQLLQVEECFKKALELNPKNDKTYFWLGWLYQNQGQLSRAKEYFEKGLAFNPSSARLYGALAAIYEATGQVARAQEYYDKASESGLRWYKLMTVKNYHTLKEMLKRRKMRLVCVQYPMRSIEPLKKIFEDNADGIIFVDNEKSFKGMVSKSSYKEYFKDIFSGDFGHCTDKGNRLLAENIANVILKEVFDK